MNCSNSTNAASHKDAPMFSRRSSSWLIRAALAPALLAGSVQAEEQVSDDLSMLIEEVIVTARKREESLQDIPVAVTALSEDYLRNNDVTQFSEMRTHVPSLGVSVGGGGTNTPIISLRGQRPSETILTLDAAVPLYFADVAMLPTHGTNVAMYDLENVQVVKGPQGTLFGRNSTGGAVLMTPRRPGNELGGNVEIKYGDYDLLSTEFGVDLPVNEDIGMRIAGHTVKRDGYQDNLATGDKEEFWDEDSTGLRVTIDAQLSRNVNNLLMLDWSESETKARVPTPVAYNPDSSTAFFINMHMAMVEGQPASALQDAVDAQSARDWNEVESDVTDGVENVKNHIAVNTTTWDINDDLSLKNILGYRKVDYESFADIDGTSFALFGSNFTSREHGTVEAEQFSNELQLFGTSLDKTLDWMLGAYYFQMQGTQSSPTQVTALFTQNSPAGDVENEAYALFGEATYHLTDRWSLTAGVRQSWDKREVTVKNTRGIFAPPSCNVFDENGVKLADENCARTESDDWSAATWRLSASYKPMDRMTMYATVSTGYRTGGFNLRGNENISLNPFDEERVTTYELGHKTDWELAALSSMRTNLAIYQQDYKDIQITQAALTDGGFGTATTNAGEATIRGAELELWAVPFQGLEIAFSYAYVDAEYDKWDMTQNISTDPANPEYVEVDVSDRPFQWIADYSGTASVRYTLPLDQSIGEVSLQTSYYFQSDMDTSHLKQEDLPLVPAAQLKEATEADSFGLLNFRVDWSGVMGSNLDLAAWVKNIKDEQYQTGGLEVLDTLGWAARVYGPPRTWGASLRYRF